MLEVSVIQVDLCSGKRFIIAQLLNSLDVLRVIVVKVYLIGLVDPSD